MNRAPAPPLEHKATSAPGDLVGPARSLQLLGAPDHPLQQLDGAAAVAERHEAAVGRGRVPAAGADVAVHDEVAALARPAELEGLELADDLERERVVELAHVDIGSATGPAMAKAWRAARRPT